MCCHLQVADDCGFLPLAIAIIGAMGSSRVNPHSPETWRGVHMRLFEEPTLVQDHVGGALAVSFRELNEKARARFRKLGVLVRGVRAPVDMVAHLWEQVGARHAGCVSPDSATHCLTWGVRCS